ncbi:MAG: AAA family ATPase [Sodaliphilus sp.]|nr:AAA family ATPase [Bacteroidales bacterium]MDY2593148.1 AAA family ATPase [Sodaliphilus sp.]MCI6224502.1 AAA family ATPase [Bacteroidales bacterium]MCI6335672.1 AAA family ATPase [Bacteroidales bacterium]MCI6577038.1 AAA family ATPase [Bacteroidales bacterium]
MLYRKIASKIESFLKSEKKRMLVVSGARQVGKSYIIREVGMRLYSNFIEVNMEEDKQSNRLFENARTVEDFMIALSTIAGAKMKDSEKTLVFIDEIQAYSHLLTLAKFLVEDGRFTYIASGSQLGIALKTTQSIPIGSIELLSMYPLDFEEFLIANGVGELLINEMRRKFEAKEALNESLHMKVMDYFRKYLLVGGMPSAVNTYLSEHNMVSVRNIHRDISLLYKNDAAKYESESLRKLKIQRIYDMVPSNLEKVKKRIVAKDIELKKGKRMADYQDEFEYLISSGITLEVQAISKPSYPLVENSGKNLLKLYMSDIGLLTGILYHNDVLPIMNDKCGVNLGSVYENVVAQELKAHGFKLYYYDNKKNGEVDFLIDSVDLMSVLPIEVKSGKDYYIHTALNNLLKVDEYKISNGIVFSNEEKVYNNGNVIYMPIYYVMFLRSSAFDNSEFVYI